MAQTGYTPILIYSSSTAAAAPAVGNLTNSTLGSELAINITDGKLFYKDNANAIQVIGWKTVPTSAGGTGLTSYTAGDLIYYASGTTFTKLGIGSAYQALQVNAGGTAPSWQPSASSVLTAQGDLLYASAANTLARLAKSTTATRYLANTGTTNNPQWDQVNLTNGVTGTLPVGNGGTGVASFTQYGIFYASATTSLSTAGAFTFDGKDFGLGNSRISGGSNTSSMTLDNTGLYQGIYWRVNGTTVAAAYTNSTTSFILGTENSSPLQFQTTGVVRGQISAAGGWSIGNTTDPGAGSLNINSVLNVGTTTNSAVVTAFKNASGRQTIYYAENASTAADAGARFRFKCGTQITDLYLNGSGNDKRFYIENNGSGVYLADGGTSWTNTSDERFKDIIEPITDAASKVSSLRSVIGKFKTDAEDKRRSFLIAQDILAVLPEAVDASNPEQLGVSYTDVIPLLVAAIKELTDRVSQLENKGA